MTSINMYIMLVKSINKTKVDLNIETKIFTTFNASLYAEFKEYEAF